MRLAVIDLGTNTFNLLIVDVDPSGKYQAVYRTKVAVKIGEGGMNQGKLQPEPIARGKKALTEYMRLIANYHCDKTFAFATSGIRSTSNGGQFVSEVKEEIGLEINVIDGDEEAELIFEGVDLAVSFSKEPMLIMDIGGGSTEFIIADETGVLWKKSYPLGVSRVLQKLQPADPINRSDLQKLDDLLMEELAGLLEECRRHKVATMVGSSGSFDSFVEMMWAEDGIIRSTNDIVSAPIDLAALNQLHQKLIVMNTPERMKVPGLVEMRVDTIHLASYMVHWVLENCGLERLLLSSYALKEGVLNRFMHNRL